MNTETRDNLHEEYHKLRNMISENENEDKHLEEISSELTNKSLLSPNYGIDNAEYQLQKNIIAKNQQENYEKHVELIDELNTVTNKILSE